MIFVSTGGIKETTAYNTALTIIEHGITAIELSGGAYEEIIFRFNAIDPTDGISAQADQLVLSNAEYFIVLRNDDLLMLI